MATDVRPTAITIVRRGLDELADAMELPSRRGGDGLALVSVQTLDEWTAQVRAASELLDEVGKTPPMPEGGR